MEILGMFDISTTWLVVIGVVLLLYMYGRKRNMFFKRYGIKGPEPIVYIGNLHQLLSKLEFRGRFHKTYGDVFGLYLGGLPMISVKDPDIMRDILIKNFNNFTDRLTIELDDYPVSKGLFFEDGAAWKRLRRILSPTFSGAKLRLMCDEMNASAKTLTSNFLKAAETGATIRIKDYFGGFTMDTIASTAFGIRVDSQNDLNNEFIQYAQKFFTEAGIANPISLIAMILPEACPLLKALGGSTWPKSSLKYFAKFLSNLIDERKADNPDAQKRRDFLQLLIDAEDDTEGTVQRKELDESKTMTHDELQGQALLFFIGGYETTASSLHFVAYCLATNPSAQERVIDELDRVLGDDEPDYDNIGELKYLDKVITETLRLYPVVPMLNRLTAETCEIKGHTFPKGATISIPTVEIHRDPKNYPNPDEFDPDRWDRKSEMDPILYLPFGQGPRHCIGMRLAQVEMKIALAQVLKKIRFVPSEETPSVLKEDDMQILAVFATKKPLKLKVTAR